MPFIARSNEAPTRPRAGSSPLGRAKVLLITGMLRMIAAPLVFGQPDDDNGIRHPSAAGGLTAPQGSAGPDSSDMAARSPGTLVGNQNQHLTVNPLTGLTSVKALDYHPLDGKARWKLYWKQNYLSVGAYFGPIFTTLVLDQAINSPGTGGSGLGSFGRRLGSRTAMSITQGTFQASIAAALHEEVRYISSGQPGFKRRALHAVAFSFLTYDNHGHTILNISNLTSYYGAAAISTTWTPIRSNVVVYTLTSATQQVALSVPINLLQEFWPDIRHKILRRP